MEIRDTGLPGLLELRPPVFEDARGRFAKPFARSAFAARGLETDWAETFFSVSRRGVIRGMHFQLPPAAHAKLVWCAAGAVLDVALDLRTGSPGFGRHVALELSAATANALYLPVGFAHGFLALTDDATLVYQTGSGHAPPHDAGIRWDSFGFDWPVAGPVVSDRDRAHPALADFVSPFHHDDA